MIFEQDCFDRLITHYKLLNYLYDLKYELDKYEIPYKKKYNKSNNLVEIHIDKL